MAVFDPPYFDFIAYDQLSDFHRAWFGGPQLAGSPLLPSGDTPTATFGSQLGECLIRLLHRLKPKRPVTFTYHSANPDAWHAVGQALDAASLRLTALWPVRSDGHMGPNSHPGNCEWDVILVCRRRDEVEPTSLSSSVAQWMGVLHPLTVAEVDQRNFRLALGMAAKRFGAVKERPSR